MAVIQKRADEIRRGDVIATFLMASSTPCPAVVLKDYSAGAVLVHDAHGKVVSVMLGYATMIPMDTPELTLAQQHAEELLGFVQTAASFGKDHVLSAKASALLDKIKPPEPPTLEEALAIIKQMSINDTEEFAEGMAKGAHLLDRARRAGVLK